MIQFSIRLVLTSLLFLPCTGWSAEIVKIKGRGCLVDLKGTPANVDDTFFAVTAEGKKKAILVIKKVKGEKAIARIIKGQAEVGMSLKSRSSGGNATAEASAPTSEPAAKSRGSRAASGFLLGFALDNMSVDLKDPNTNASTGTVALSGNAFSAKYLFDYRLFSQVWFRGTTGLDSFVASGSSKCTETQKAVCDVKIYYLSFDALARFVFTEKGSLHPWAGGGFGLLFPMSKSSTALDSSSISNTSVTVVAGGLDWVMQSGAYFPVSIEYSLLPTSNDVKGNWIAVRAGMVWPF